MAKRSHSGKSPLQSKGLENTRRPVKPTLQDTLKGLSDRAHDRANRRIAPPGQRKSIQAAIQATRPAAFDDDPADDTGILTRITRWLIGLLLMPIAWITTLAFFTRLSHATVHQDFWKTSEFWYFMIGCILLSTWLLSGFFRNFFLYLYVLGHELTHAMCVVLSGGRVTDFHVSTSGGYITTNKTNLVITLSPYFVPFYSLWVVLLQLILRFFDFVSELWDPVFYLLIGVTWMFHMIWTLWMLPKDQPDLQENGQFLSLIVIYLGNLFVLTALICAADASPVHFALEFAREWARIASVVIDQIFTAASHWLDVINDHNSGMPST